MSSPQALTRQQDQLAAQRASIEQEMAGHRSGDAKLPELQGELAMVDARKNLLDTMTEFVNESDPKGEGEGEGANALKAHIDVIAATVPTSSALGLGSPPAAAVTAASRATLGTSGATSAAMGGAGPASELAPPAQLQAFSARSDALAQAAAVGCGQRGGGRLR